MIRMASVQGVEGVSIGKVVMGLYGNIAPKTAANFKALCKGHASPPTEF